MRDALHNLKGNETDNLLSSWKEEQLIITVSEKMKIIDSLTKALQSDSTTITGVHALFNEIVKRIPSIYNWLKAYADIVYSS